MEDYEEMASKRLHQPLAPRRRGRRWLLICGLAFALMLALGIGTLIGSTGATQAAALTFGSANGSQPLAVAQTGSRSSQTLTFSQGNVDGSQPLADGQRGQGQCVSLTVSSVNGNTIVAKTASGSSVTVHTTASTRYNQAGKTVAASSIKAGTQIHVMGTHNSDGSITATSIDIH